MSEASQPLSYSISLSRLLNRLETSLDEDKIKSLKEVDLRKAAAVRLSATELF